MSNIQEPLKKIFDRHRIVFWYDTDKELRADYETLDLPDVIKVELDNNEFGIKHRILRKEPKAKFLIYHVPRHPSFNKRIRQRLLCSGFAKYAPILPGIFETLRGVERIFRGHQTCRG